MKKKTGKGVQKGQATGYKERQSSGCQKNRQGAEKNMKGTLLDRQEGVKRQAREREKTSKKGGVK